MFAGPNGSGKSTLKRVLPENLLGIYLNPDDMEQEIRSQSFLDLSSYDVAATSDAVLSFFTYSDLLKSAQLADAAQRLTFRDDRLNFSNVEVNSYFASVACDFIRQLLLKKRDVLHDRNGHVPPQQSRTAGRGSIQRISDVPVLYCDR